MPDAKVKKVQVQVQVHKVQQLKISRDQNNRIAVRDEHVIQASYQDVISHQQYAGDIHSTVFISRDGYGRYIV